MYEWNIYINKVLIETLAYSVQIFDKISFHSYIKKQPNKQTKKHLRDRYSQHKHTLWSAGERMESTNKKSKQQNHRTPDIMINTLYLQPTKS